MDFTRLIKSIVSSLFSAVLCIATTVLPARSAAVHLDVDGDIVSADIQDVSLKRVIKQIEEETGIWFRLMISENAPVLSEDISIRFEEEPLEEGLDRILRPVNHSLVFDTQNNVIGVFLFGKPGRRGHRRSTRPVRRNYPVRVRRR
jgi:hypothetical protein